MTKRDGAELDLSPYRGKVIYLDFWASWCKPCKKSFPWMREMHQRLGNQGLEVVTVNLDRDRTAAASFLERNSVPFPIIYDPEGKLAKAYRIEAMPTSLVYDRLGELRTVHLGFKESEAKEWEAEIISLLAESPPDSGRGESP